MSLCPALGAAARAGRRQCLQTTWGLLMACALPALALDKPAGAVMLTITGRVRSPNDGMKAQFDMPMLEALPHVLAAAGAQGSMLRMTALNDYRVDMPFDDTQRHDVIVARLIDDKPMAVRDKGPLFVIYPFDAEPELRSAIYYSRSAWQLKTIDVL
jgi:hypothetical protein